MLFWIIAALMAAVVAATLLAPLLRRNDAGAPDVGDMAVYRDQLAEIDRDLARGVLAPDEAERSRIEVSRRLLAADKAGARAVTEAPPRASRVLAGVIAVSTVGGGLVVYDALGAPGYPDIPRAQRIAEGAAIRDGRMSQSAAEQAMAAARLAGAEPDPAAEAASRMPADYVAMVEELRQLVPQRPDDLQGWRLLALHEAQLGNFGAAARAQERVIQIRGDDATAKDRIDLVDRMVAAAGGFVSPEAEAVLRTVLESTPDDFGARYYYGLLYAQTDRPDLAFRLWRDVVNEGPADVPYVALARAQVEDAAFRAGTDYTLPPERGPNADDIAAAADLSPEAQQAMIQNMVAQLSDRLATQGGTAEEWARLITAHGVLGDTEQANAIWTEAREVFASSDAAMAMLNEAAARAGLEPVPEAAE